jgi:hypothetical protein
MDMALRTGKDMAGEADNKAPGGESIIMLCACACRTLRISIPTISAQ